MRIINLSALYFFILSMMSCDNSFSYKIINKKNIPINISYDNRFYRSDLETKHPVISDTIIYPNGEFFIGISSSSIMEAGDIWPTFISIKSKEETITLNGKKSILNVLNIKGKLILK